MTPIRRMAAILFVLSLFVLAAALYAARPVCSCVLGNDWQTIEEMRAAGYDQPEDCPIHADATFAQENEQ